MTRNYFNYFTEIEEYFVRKRSRSLLVSPLDWCLIELWKDNGIPLQIVMRGIDRSFESAQKRGKSAPRTLFYCHPAVVEAYEEYQETMLGKAEQEDEVEPSASGEEYSRDSVFAFLSNLQKQMEGMPGAVFERARSRLSQLISEVTAGSSLDLGEMDRELSEIGVMLVTTLKQDLDQETLRSIRSEIRKELRVYKKHLSSELYDKLKQKQLERRLREHLQLPEFSLLNLETG